MKCCSRFFVILLFLVFFVNSSPDCLNMKNKTVCGHDRYCINQECVHKSFSPISKFDIFVCLSFFFASAGSILSGIGGGMVFSSLLVFICNFKFKEAIPLSVSLTLVQNTIMVIYYNLKKHPTLDKNLIRFDNFLIILPNIFIGNVVGYFFHHIFSQILSSFLFSFLLIFFLYLSVKKGTEKYLEESALFEREKELKYDDNPENVELINAGIDSNQINIETDENANTSNFALKITLFLSSILIYFAYVMLKGGKYAKPLGNIEVCSKAYYIIVFSHLGIQSIFSIIFIIILVKQEKNQENDSIKADGKITFSLKMCIMLSIIGFFIGLLAVLFGIGGGSMNTMMLIAIGFDPLNAIATSAVVREISILSSLLLFIVNDMIEKTYVFVLCLSIIITSITGAFILNYVLDKFRRTSFFSFFMSLMFTLSLIITFVTIYKEFSDPKKPKIYEFHPFCPKK